MKSSICPACGSERTQKATILYKSGIPISTEIAKKISPPLKPTSVTWPVGRCSIYIGAWLLTIGIYVMGTSHTIRTDHIDIFLQTMGGILMFLGFLLLALSQLKLNAREVEYREDYAKWERLWYCSHCGNTFYDA